MEEAVVLLIDVPEPYRAALATAARQRGARPIVLEGELPGVAPRELGLCIAGTDRGPEAATRLRALVAKLRPWPVVAVGERPATRAVVELVKLGVADVIALPAPPADVVADAFGHFRRDAPQPRRPALIGESARIRELRREIEAAAATRSTTLILGETGTGKGLVAELIHRSSKRRERPFVHVDCAALSPTLIESELFGHEKGAFTGASQRRVGRFELVDDGTIFLDEVGDLDAPLQAKLLRVLQEHRFERVGGTRTMLMRGRVIAATSRDLQSAVRQGRFRRDLYFRLNVLKLTIPPLRERLDDIPQLVRHGLREIGGRLGVPVPGVSGAFQARLATYHWPGNVRELMNALERCLVHLRVDTLQPQDLDELLEELGQVDQQRPSQPRALVSSEVGGFEQPTEEREIIREALRSTGGNVARVARRLGVPRTTLRRRIREYGLGHLIPRD